MVQRMGYVLAKEVEDYMTHHKADDAVLPMPAKPSTSEGMCGIMKYLWNLSNNVRTRDELLRSKVAAATSSLRCWC